MNFRARQRNLRDSLLANRTRAGLITHLPNIRYLCGFTGSSGVLACRVGRSASGMQLAFFTDGRYAEQARDEVHGVRVVIAKKPALTAASEWIAGRDSGTVAIEAEHVTLSSYSVIRKLVGKARLKPISGMVERLRMIKDADELAVIRKAVLLGSELFDVAVKAVRPGVTESSVAGKMEHAARDRGAEKMSFDTIVAAGTRSALPHGRASNAPIPRSGFCILDFGVILAGYCSDMTRTLWVGRPDSRARAMYEAVRQAQQAGIEAVRPGVTAGDVDRAARRVLEKAGFARYFTHSTGHGVGLEIHEPPRIGQKQLEVLQPGMVITIEPGIYVPGTGGVRIEDMVVVTPSGCEVLTPTTKDLIAI